MEFFIDPFSSLWKKMYLFLFWHWFLNYLKSFQFSVIITYFYLNYSNHALTTNFK